MTEAEMLAEAYFTLGMKPGGSRDAVHSRWKRLAMVWHSDRFTSADAKEEAEEEMKNINNARDILKKHFETSHNAGGPCACNSTTTTKQSSGAGPGPGKRRSTQETDQEESDAARRSKQRADQAAKAAAEKAAAEKAAQEAKARAEAEAAAQAAARSKLHAEQTAVVASEKLRWKIALCMGVAWVVVSSVAFGLTSVKGWWIHLNEKWEQERQWKQQDEEQKKAAAKAAEDKVQQDQQQAENEQKQRDIEAQEQKNKQINQDRATIQQQQEIIDHCNAEISKAQAQMGDSRVDGDGKNRYQDWIKQQQKFLSDAQDNYNLAQQDLAGLTGIPAPTPLGNGTSTTTVPHIQPLKYPEMSDFKENAAPHVTPVGPTLQKFIDNLPATKDLTKPAQ